MTGAGTDFRDGVLLLHVLFPNSRTETVVGLPVLSGIGEVYRLYCLGRTVRIDFWLPAGSIRGLRMGSRLYVGNLPFSADEDVIRQLFSQDGRTVSEVKLITDRDTGRPRGFGFVEMSNSEEADAAVSALNGFAMDGRPLTVNEAKERSSGGGGRGGGGGGYDRY